MPNSKLSEEIEAERGNIADLQGRVKDLVKRREQVSSDSRPGEIDELNRQIDQLKHAPSNS